ncbi:MAG: ISAs1 family transposase [Acidobacteria bacterium]|nr:ISAs1 family transposase [Acidobacteriota bacterium]MCA1638452.1 ISAs1 family transposase [Acidobacteriota bacterium]
MSELKVQPLFESLTIIKDPRIERTKLHSLIDILVIAICAMICGAEDWEDIAEFGEAKREWLATFLELKNGIPSHDTFRRVFILLDSDELKVSFLDWIRSAVSLSGGSLVNIDGKNLRGSKSGINGKKALNVVSAWAAEQSVVLGQVKCAEKSNEIQAIPELLKLLELQDCIVTIDAIGCQKEIVAEIVEKKADYVISLKGNQGILHREVKDYLDWAERIKFKEIEFDYSETLEKGHGRIERRRCWVTEEIGWLTQRAEWSNLKSVMMVESEGEVLGGAKTVDRRYFISSLEADATRALRCVRGHWAIENELHWCLDIGFREDDCRTRVGNAPENLAIIRHLGLNLLKQETSSKRGIKGKRKKAGWDEGYLLKVLNF